MGNRNAELDFLGARQKLSLGQQIVLNLQIIHVLSQVQLVIGVLFWQRNCSKMEFHPNQSRGQGEIQANKGGDGSWNCKVAEELRGQFLENPSPFLLVKQIIEFLWSSYDMVDAFLLE